MSTNALELRRVTKSFVEAGAQRRVLDGIDLQLEAGERTALLGRSGSGKSTLLHLAAGLDAPDDGEIWLGSVRLDTATERARTLLRRREVGIVFQSFDLIPTLNVEENVLLGLDLDGRRDAAAQERAQALLDAVGLSDRATTFPDRLSGGEQQRVAIARALVHRPALVLADEPTGNLDAVTGEVVLDLFEQLANESGSALLLATHSREAARRMDRVVELIDGKLTAETEPTA